MNQTAKWRYLVKQDTEQSKETSTSPSSSQAQRKEEEDESYEYELIGVTVHTGTADGGHYYAFIREQSSSSSSPTPPCQTSSSNARDSLSSRSAHSHWLNLVFYNTPLLTYQTVSLFSVATVATLLLFRSCWVGSSIQELFSSELFSTDFGPNITDQPPTSGAAQWPRTSKMQQI